MDAASDLPEGIRVVLLYRKSDYLASASALSAKNGSTNVDESAILQQHTQVSLYHLQISPISSLKLHHRKITFLLPGVISKVFIFLQVFISSFMEMPVKKQTKAVQLTLLFVTD